MMLLKEMQDKINKSDNLQELCWILNGFYRSDDEKEKDLYNNHVDLSDLPTFGGEKPHNTNGIFSWDKKHFLIFCVYGGWDIVDRSVWVGD